MVHSHAHSHYCTSVNEVLHQFPAVYIGSIIITKQQSVDQMIGKVLQEKKPSGVRNITVALSLSEVQLSYSKLSKSAVFEDDEEVGEVLSHETSRIRVTGVLTEDKRFAGYIVKEVGKPQECHVIRCNSAALMISFSSFLRQSCQLTSLQRGGSFYDEISTDESDEWELPLEVRERVRVFRLWIKGGVGGGGLSYYPFIIIYHIILLPSSFLCG